MAAIFPTGVATDADLKVLVNNISTTLDGAIDGSTTTVVLADASSFPTAGFVTIGAEAISYTGKSTNTLTGVTRGADGTTAASHVSGERVLHLFMAAHHNAVKDEIIAIETVLNRLDGWTPVTDSWSYASATTITVPSGAAAKYAVGDKIKLTQTTVKYFYVVGVADTVLTVTGGSAYTVANAAIASPHVSHYATPVGFPGYFPYTVSYAGDGSLTVTEGAGDRNFSLTGRVCTVQHGGFVTFGGTTSNRFTVTLPVASAKQYGGMPSITVNNTLGRGAHTDSTHFGIYRIDANNYELATFGLNFTYSYLI